MPNPWPAVLVPSSEDWRTNAGTGRSGGRTPTNQEQLVDQPSGYARASLTIPCFTPDKVRAARMVRDSGRVATWTVGPCEAARAPWNVDFAGGAITYGRAAKRPDIYTGEWAPTLDFTLAADAAMNATALTIQRARGGGLAPGMLFSIGDRLHTIVAAADGSPAGSQGAPGSIQVAIRPWLRADHPAGTPIEFGRPVGTMRLASEDTGALDLQLSRLGSVTFDLVEAFDALA